MLVVVIALFLLGWASRGRLAVPATILQWADRYVINIALPAVIVAKVSQVELSAKSGIPIAAAWGSMMLCALIVLAIGARLTWSRSRIGALMLVGVLGNTSFLGIEVVRTLLGDDHVAAAVTYDQIGTFLALSLYGTWIAGKYGSSESGWRPIAKRISRFTPFIALMVSVGLRFVDVPSEVISVLNGVGKTVAPVAMAALGARFTFRWHQHIKWIVLGVLSLKMLMVPSVLIVIGLLMGDIHSIEWSTSILQSAAPPMVTAGIVAISAGFDEELVVSIVGLGTLLSFVSLPLFAWVI